MSVLMIENLKTLVHLGDDQPTIIDHSIPENGLTLDATWTDYKKLINKRFDLIGDGLYVLMLNGNGIDFEGKHKDMKVIETLTATEDEGPHEIECYFYVASCNLPCPWRTNYKIEIGNATDEFIEAEVEYDVATFSEERANRSIQVEGNVGGEGCALNVNIGGRQGRLRNLDSITDPKIKIAPHLRGEFHVAKEMFREGNQQRVMVRIYKSGQTEPVCNFTSKIDRIYFAYKQKSEAIVCQKKKKWTKVTSKEWIIKDPKTNVNPHGNFNRTQKCRICNFSRSNNSTSHDNSHQEVGILEQGRPTHAIEEPKREQPKVIQFTAIDEANSIIPNDNESDTDGSEASMQHNANRSRRSGFCPLL